MAQVWKIAPGEGTEDWELAKKHGCICLGWPIGDFRKFKSKSAVLRKLKQAYPEGGDGTGTGAAQSIFYFTYEVMPGDVVVANKGMSEIVGMGVVTSSYIPPRSPKNPLQGVESTWRKQARTVDWRVKVPIKFAKPYFAIPTVTRIKTSKCREIKSHYMKAYPNLRKTVEELFAGVEDFDSTTTVLKTAEVTLDQQGFFDPKGLRDARRRVLTAIVRRRGQQLFRQQLFSAYERRCAITACTVEGVLEAAHIVPYRGPKTDHVGNGLLLRSDLHTLFDCELMAVDEETYRVLVAPELRGSEYWEFNGKKLRLPRQENCQPNRDALKRHRLRSGLGC